MGNGSNCYVVGVKVILEVNSQIFMQEFIFFCGFQFVMYLLLYFGFGEVQFVDKFIVFWFDGMIMVFCNILVD